ncbi:MAG: transglutaminase domain-containing protein [Cyanobacteria bacterium J06621_12]
MTTKGSFKLQPSSHKQDNYLSRKLVSTILGITLLGSIATVYRVIDSFEQQQLISLPSEIFASYKYQPIEPGDAAKLEQIDFSEIDRLAQKLDYSGSSVTELASLLAANAPTESAKARIIYAWITQHITYDVAAFNDAIENDNYPEVDPIKVLGDRTTICSGYSNLYHALAEAMNLEAAIVIGYAKGATPPNDIRFQDVNHSWNSVQIDGAWYLLDATFGAGSIEDGKYVPKYNPYYFATAPQQFINKHYPEDLGWQLLSQTHTRKSFDNLPQISPRFYNLGLEAISHQNSQIATATRLDIQLKLPQDIVAIAELKQNNQNLPPTSVLVNRQGENAIISVAPPKAGTYDLIIYARHKDDLAHYGEAIKYQILATNSTAELPKVYSHFYQHQVNLIEPLAANLAPDWSTYFNLIVPGAVDVQVINTETKQWTTLDGYGDYFAGNVEIKPGTTAIAAKFPGDEQYWQLVEYQAQNASTK